MNNLTFITGNQSKADHLARLLDMPLAHHKLSLDEIQSLDLREVVEHKVRQAYAVLSRPVLVEDVALEFTALGRLPGTFIKFFVDELPLQTVCDMLDGFSDRSAIARCMFAVYDGQDVTYFERSLTGCIAVAPGGDNGFGWDRIFIPEAQTSTSASLNKTDYGEFYRSVKPIDELALFMRSHR